MEKKEATKRHKRAKILPGEQVAFNTRASTTQFAKTIEQLSDVQKQWAISLGFGGMLHLKSMDVMRELCDWLVSRFNTEYCYIDLEGGRKLHVTETDVGSVFGVPCSGANIDVRGVSMKATITTLLQLEQSVVEESREGEFKKLFCIYSCATVLSPSSTEEKSMERMKVYKPVVARQVNAYDCGIYVVEFMTKWQSGGLTRQIQPERAPYYCFRQLIRLIHHSNNKSFPQLPPQDPAERVPKKSKAN